MTTTPSSRPRGSRRESTSSLSGNTNRVRKNSTSSIGSGIGGNVRPRANTISHIDGGSIGMLGAASRSVGNLAGLDTPFQPSGPGAFQPRGMSASTHMRGNMPTLPRLATQGHNMHMGGELRTAPVGHGVSHFGGLDTGFPAFNPTVNPAQLHLSDSMGMMNSPALNQSPFTPQPVIMEDEGDFEWMQHGFNTQMSFGGQHGQPMAESAVQDSPQHMGGHMHGFGEVAFDPSHVDPSMLWSPSSGMNTEQSAPLPHEALHPVTSNFDTVSQTLSPSTLHQPMMPETIYEHSALNINPNGSSNLTSFPSHFQPQNSRAFSSDGTDGSSATGSAGRQSSVTSTSIDSINDSTRNALLFSLSQPSLFGPRKFPQTNGATTASTQGPSLPSTGDLQRYLHAYVQYFHPHMPFIHVPTLSFDMPSLTSNNNTSDTNTLNTPHGSTVGGNGCLILAMAAIGALYEFERQAFKDLFDAARRMIQLFLEERRHADTNPSGKPNQDSSAQDTPLWLVQAFLLNVVSGHQAEDKITGNIASTHCIALVNLARSAGLLERMPDDEASFRSQMSSTSADVQMGDTPVFHDPFGSHPPSLDEASSWYRWISLEERKRTLFSIFHMSSLLVIAYNHSPALMNSEIMLDLPCDEALWRADNPQAWLSKRREIGDNTGVISFPQALSELLTADQKQGGQRPMRHGQPFGSAIPREEVPQSNLKPSTYGSLILIDALHNYIWETRQRHSSSEWTTMQTESMHAHIEPSLRSWHAAWLSKPEHGAMRPNPYGHGPLSADSAPLLDLAYVRLFVNLGTSKDALWQRDYETMSNEIARGLEFIQHAENSGDQSTYEPSTAIHSPVAADLSKEQDFTGELTRNEESFGDPSAEQPLSRREKHLRRAARYAADNLIFSDQLGVTFGDFSARELPVQSALCAFDCAQVLAEWIATVQERVGQYLGIIGRDPIDFANVPAIALLSEEDAQLIGKCEDILRRAESKMANELDNPNLNDVVSAQMMSNMPSRTVEGYGSKILRTTSCILGRSLVWPGKFI